MMKIIKFLFIFFVLAVIIAFVFKDAILKAAVETGVSRVTGFQTKVSSIHYTFPSTIHIQGLKINNPANKGFRQKVFVDIPEIYASLGLDELLKQKKIHLPEVRLNIAEVNIEKNKQGQTNVQLLSSVGGTPGAAKPAPKKTKPMAFLLDRFELTMRKVSYEDQTGLMPGVPGAKVLPKEITGVTSRVSGMAPKRVAVDMNINKQVFTNITDPKALVNLILVKIIHGTTFGNLLGLNPEAIMRDTLKGAIGTGGEIFSGTLNQANTLLGSSATQLTETSGDILKGTLGSTQGALGDVSGSATNQVKGLFGKLKSTVQAAGERVAAETK